MDFAYENKQTCITGSHNETHLLRVSWLFVLVTTEVCFVTGLYQ